MAITRKRQYRVTHTETGLVTIVNHIEYLLTGGWHADRGGAAYRAGLRYPADCKLKIVPFGQEVPIPFDSIPLILRHVAH